MYRDEFGKFTLTCDHVTKYSIRETRIKQKLKKIKSSEGAATPEHRAQNFNKDKTAGNH